MNTPKAILDAQNPAAGAEKVAKLTACGQKHGGKTVIAQWVYLPTEEADGCDYNANRGLPVTGCYRVMENFQDLTGASDEEKKQFVADCLDQ